MDTLSSNETLDQEFIRQTGVILQVVSHRDDRKFGKHSNLINDICHDQPHDIWRLPTLLIMEENRYISVVDIELGGTGLRTRGEVGGSSQASS